MSVGLALRPSFVATEATPRRPLRFHAARVLLAVLAVGLAAVVLGAVYDDATRVLVLDNLALVAGGFAVGLLAVLLLRAPLNRSARRTEACDSDDDPGLVVDGAADLLDEPAPVAAVPADVSPRALLMQVRTLEATLAEEDVRLDAVRHDAARRAEEQVRRELERVRTTLRAMREVVATEPGDVAVGRIEAALDRLAADGFERPTLSRGSAAGVAVRFAPPVAVSVPAPPAVVGDEVAPVIEPADAAGAATPAPAEPAERDDVPVAAEPTGPPRVLPVPPPPAPAPPTRRGRRLRRPVGV